MTSRLLVSETIILANVDLTDADRAEISAMLSEKYGDRVSDRTFMDSSTGPVVIGVFSTGREFELDFRPHVVSERYPIEEGR